MARSAIALTTPVFPGSEGSLLIQYVPGIIHSVGKPRFIHESIRNGSISMRSFEIR
jgi:hypothetical protein